MSDTLKSKYLQNERNRKVSAKEIASVTASIFFTVRWKVHCIEW